MANGPLHDFILANAYQSDDYGKAAIRKLVQSQRRKLPSFKL
jgi:hypothetical protein